MNTKLFPYQKKGAKRILKLNGRCLLADEMGLGKTIQTLKYLKKHPSKRPVIIICPSFLKYTWKSQALQHANLHTHILSSTTPKKIHLNKKNQILIINYAILQYWKKYLKKINPQVIILDECHYIKSRGAKRTRAVRSIARKAPHIISISGTPIVNRPAELWTNLNLLWPKIFPSFWSFGWKYCKPTKRPWGSGGWEFKGATNLPHLHRKLKKLGMIRRLKKDVLKDLPEKSRFVITLPIKKRSEYEQAQNNFLIWLKKQSHTKAKKAARAEKLVKLGCLKRLAAELKLKSVFEWVDTFLEESDEKLVLFCTHRKIIREIHKRYGKISVMVDGSVTGHKRRDAVNLFQRKKRIKLFIGNIRAAGLGLDLYAASVVAFVELDWVPGNHAQAEDRIHRIGQKKKAIIYYLIAKKTIEMDLCELLQKKQKVLDATLDGHTVPTGLSVMKQLVKRMAKKKGKKQNGKKASKKNSRSFYHRNSQ